MAWNLFLAGVPFVLALALYNHRRERTAMWWAGAALFVGFLPNAPYVLTDVVHLPADMRHTTDRVAVFGLLPEYAIYFLAGFGFYLGCIALVRWGLADVGLKRFATPVELLLHGLAAVGMYVGRFWRFNTWDVVTRPSALLERVGPPRQFAVAVVVLTFVMLAAGVTAVRMVPTIRVGPPPGD
jgi:uncharacterized membrane protein